MRMDEMERQDNLPAASASEREDKPIPEEEAADYTGAEPEDEEEEKPRLYFGRFTAGVWRGGVLGIALSYILLGLAGALSTRYDLGWEQQLETGMMKYIVLAAVCYGGGKLGGMLEKRSKKDAPEEGES